MGCCHLVLRKIYLIKFQCLKKKSVDIIHFFPFHYIPLLLIHYLRKLRRICFIFYIIHIINYFSLFVTYGNIENSKYIFVLYCFSMKVRNTRKYKLHYEIYGLYHIQHTTYIAGLQFAIHSNYIVIEKI